MRILLLSAVIASQLLSAQIGKVGINTTSPKATLDMRVADVNASGTTPEGLLIPKLGRERVNNMGPTVEQGTMVYINSLDGLAGGRVSNVNKVGFYHFNGSEWIGLDNQKTPYDVTLTPSATTINIGESISLNIKSNIPSQFFYSSQNKGALKKAINNEALSIPEFTVIGSEGNAINPAGTDFIFTPNVPGNINLICYFFDSDNNLITKQLNIQVNGQLGEELVKINTHNKNPNSQWDYLEFQLNSSGSTQYQFKIERTSGSPYPLFEDTNTYGNFVYGQWYNYLNQPIGLDYLKQLPGINNIKISVKKNNSSIIEAFKEIEGYRKHFVDETKILPLSKTLQLGQSVELKMLAYPEFLSSPIQDDIVYMIKTGVLSTNLPIKIYSYNSSNTLIRTTILDESGLAQPGSSFPGVIFTMQPNDPGLPPNSGIVSKNVFEPQQTGTYILRFSLIRTGRVVEDTEREITVVINVIP